MAGVFYGNNDPYAANYRSRQIENAEIEKKAVIEDTTRLMYAAGCKVIMYGPAVGAVKSRITAFVEKENLVAPERYNGGTLHEIELLAQKGFEYAKQDGACQYWHDNPDAVYEVRKYMDTWMDTIGRLPY